MSGSGHNQTELASLLKACGLLCGPHGAERAAGSELTLRLSIITMSGYVMTRMFSQRGLKLCLPCSLSLGYGGRQL